MSLDIHYYPVKENPTMWFEVSRSSPGLLLDEAPPCMPSCVTLESALWVDKAAHGSRWLPQNRRRVCVACLWTRDGQWHVRDWTPVSSVSKSKDSEVRQAWHGAHSPVCSLIHSPPCMAGCSVSPRERILTISTSLSLSDKWLPAGLSQGKGPVGEWRMGQGEKSGHCCPSLCSG